MRVLKPEQQLQASNFETQLIMQVTLYDHGHKDRKKGASKGGNCCDHDHASKSTAVHQHSRQHGHFHSHAGGCCGTHDHSHAHDDHHDISKEDVVEKKALKDGEVCSVAQRALSGMSRIRFFFLFFLYVLLPLGLQLHLLIQSSVAFSKWWVAVQ